MTIANDSAAFEFRDVKLGVVYHARVTADGFNEWDSPKIVFSPDNVESAYFTIGASVCVDKLNARS